MINIPTPPELGHVLFNKFCRCPSYGEMPRGFLFIPHRRDFMGGIVSCVVWGDVWENGIDFVVLEFIRVFDDRA